VLHVFRRDDGETARRFSALCDPPRRVKDLVGMWLSRERRGVDVLGVAHDPFDRAARVIDGAGTLSAPLAWMKSTCGSTSSRIVRSSSALAGAGRGLSLADGRFDTW